MKKTIILITILSLFLTACGSMEKVKKEEEHQKVYEKTQEESGIENQEKKEEELQEAYEKMQEESRIKNQEKKESSEYLFGFLQIDDFTIDRSETKAKVKARITNNCSETLVGHMGLTVYDKDMNIIDNQYVALPSFGVKHNESFLVDEYINKDNYYTVKFTDADMVRIR